MTIRNQAFLESIGCTEGEVADARFKRTQTTAMAAALLGGKAKRKAKPIKKSWDDCQALAKILGVTFGHKAIVFADGYSFENGRMYCYGSSNSSVYEALLQLQSDRLAAKSNDEIATESVEAHEMIEDVEDAWSKARRERFAGYTDADMAIVFSSCNDVTRDREDRQADKAANFEMSINK